MQTLSKTGKDMIFTDGLARSGQQEPPGQRSVYIPSGDTWKESYRLSTFSQFFNTAVSPSQLAASGFYYTGFKDRVRCFCCGLTVENWIQGDNPTDKRWHQGNCDLANGRETYNEPSTRPFWKWRRVSPLLQNSSASSSILLTPQQSPTVISSGNYVQQSIESIQNLPGLSTSVESNSASNHVPAANTTQNVNRDYPCESPLNSHMTSVVRRIESFQPRNGIRWPADRLRASVDEIANAGFFFLGERDRVKCFYCNGGLQNWEYGDDPWTEHAKWFPSCEYTLRVKGPEFVRNIVDQFPNIDRPVPTRPRPRLSNIPGGDIPPQLSTEQAVEQAMTSTLYVKQAVEMGFDRDAIKTVLKRKYETNRNFFSSAEEFMEAVFSHQSRTSQSSGQTNSQSTSHQNQTASANQDISPQTPPNEPLDTQSETTSIRSVASELQELENSRLCRKCRKSVSNIVLIPCGHLASCEPCSKNLKKCPICHLTVQTTMKAFRS